MTLPNAVREQNAYALSLSENNFPFTLAVGAAFVRGMREVGYRNTATALCELIDNAEQAEAGQVHVIFGYEKGDKKPTSIAIVDDGHGMSPEMLRASVLWGGTHREGDRQGLGRFGYGLPSSCVSQGRKFQVYSRQSDAEWNTVGIDLDQIAEGLLTTEAGHIIVPPAECSPLPEFVEKYVSNSKPLKGLRSGTVVVIDKLDRVDRKTTSKLIELLVTHFGVTYHKIIGRCRIYVDGKTVDPIDPLFVTPAHKWFDFDEDRAKPMEPIQVKVRATDGRPGGSIKVRLAFLPYTFQALDKSRRGRSSANLNGRFHVMRDYNGIIVCRNGRVIECKGSTPWTRFQNNDRHVRVELDFSASLDDEFHVNTSKQRVDLSDRIWDLLRQNGLEKAIQQIRQLYIEDKSKSDSAANINGHRSSAVERVLQRTLTSGQSDVAPHNDRELNGQASAYAKEKGLSLREAKMQLRLRLEDSPYKLGQKSIPGGDFFEVEQVNGQRVLWVNTSHPWFRLFYSRSDIPEDARRVIELLLFTLGDRVLDSRNEAHQMLSYELGQWSERLESALLDFEQHFADPEFDTDAIEPAAS